MAWPASCAAMMAPDDHECGGRHHERPGQRAGRRAEALPGGCLGRDQPGVPECPEGFDGLVGRLRQLDLRPPSVDRPCAQLGRVRRLASGPSRVVAGGRFDDGDDLARAGIPDQIGKRPGLRVDDVGRGFGVGRSRRRDPQHADRREPEPDKDEEDRKDAIEFPGYPMHVISAWDRRLAGPSRAFSPADRQRRF